MYLSAHRQLWGGATMATGIGNCRVPQHADLQDLTAILSNQCMALPSLDHGAIQFLNLRGTNLSGLDYTMQPCLVAMP